MITRVLAALARDEGNIPHLYYDSLGVPTIGIGCNLRDTRLPLELAHRIVLEEGAAEEILLWQFDKVKADVSRLLPWVRSLSEARQDAVEMLAFNMGIGNLIGKNPMVLAALKRSDWKGAAQHLLGGTYEKQVGDRARRIARILETGEWK